MAEKNLKARIVHKHDIEANWLLATNFTPKQGEIIVYDIDGTYLYERIKIGDGVQNVNALPFADDALRETLIAQINAVDDKVDAVSTLVGDSSVATQIDEALANSQSDWSQFDETAADYIKNRTHWLNQSYTVVTPETIIESTSPATYDYSTGLTTDDQGKQFVIIWDGAEYTCTVNVKSGMSRYFYCGNGSLYSSALDDTGEPFCFYISSGAPKIYYTSGTSHTYQVLGDFYQDLKQLDEVYIPDTIARVDDIPVNPVSNLEASGQDLAYTKDDGTDGIIKLITTGVKVQDRGNGYHYMIEMYNGKLVTSCCCVSILVTSPPTTNFMVGDVFDTTGMVVTATCEDGSTKVITDYAHPEYITADSMEISYVEDGKTFVTYLSISPDEFDPETVLVDFEYTANDDGTYTLTAWKGTYNGEASTRIVVPTNALVIVDV